MVAPERVRCSAQQGFDVHGLHFICSQVDEVSNWSGVQRKAKSANDCRADFSLLAEPRAILRQAAAEVDDR
jgi:hypothetical protein